MAKVRQVKVTWEKSPNDRSFSVCFKDTGRSYKYTERDLIEVITWYHNRYNSEPNLRTLLRMLNSCAHGYRILSHEARLFMDLYHKRARTKMWAEIQERRQEEEEKEREQDDE